MCIRDSSEPLTNEDIQWIMKKEQDHTLILRWVPGHNSNPASGGGETFEDGTWYLRTGNYITLAEVFRFGAKLLSAHHLYQFYMHLDVYINRKQHSVSSKEEAVKTQNAKQLHKHETGSWGLPAEGEPWERESEDWNKGHSKRKRY